MIPKHLGKPIGAQTYFITSCTWQKRHIFQVELWARIFLKNLYHYKREGKYLLHAFVLMTDHFHLLITPLAGMTLERAVQLVKGGSAYRLKQEGRSGLVWQKGFTDRRVRDRKEYLAFVEYIHQNPVEARLVENAADYRYSSAFPGWKLDPPRDYLSG